MLGKEIPCSKIWNCYNTRMNAADKTTEKALAVSDLLMVGMHSNFNALIAISFENITLCEPLLLKKAFINNIK